MRVHAVRAEASRADAARSPARRHAFLVLVLTDRTEVAVARAVAALDAAGWAEIATGATGLIEGEAMNGAPAGLRDAYEDALANGVGIVLYADPPG